MIWHIYGYAHPDCLGFIPSFISDDDPRPIKEQIDANYQHGGGWRPIKGFIMTEDHLLHFPGDPPYRPLALGIMRNRCVILYEYSFLAISEEPGGEWEVARVD
jgi:hypothetical protein